jgi:pimeloyl-ACP methyl ester carboxylesterase
MEESSMTTILIRGVSLFVKVVGGGYPLVLMHGGPGLDYQTLLPLQPLSNQFTLILYDHRCNGRSEGEVTSMTMGDLTADADALRQTLGFERRYDFLFPTEHQVALAGGIPNAHLEIIECAGHSPHMEQPAAVQRLIRDFLATAPGGFEERT